MKVGYSKVSGLSQKPNVRMLLLLLVVFPFKVFSYRVNATGPTYLSRLEITLEPNVWNRA